MRLSDSFYRVTKKMQSQNLHFQKLICLSLSIPKLDLDIKILPSQAQFVEKSRLESETLIRKSSRRGKNRVSIRVNNDKT